VQLPGFKAGVDAGADAVMVTAVFTPGLGSGSTPALFSPATPLASESRSAPGRAPRLLKQWTFVWRARSTTTE